MSPCGPSSNRAAGLVGGPVGGNANVLQGFQDLGRRVQAGEIDPEEARAAIEEMRQQVAEQGQPTGGSDAGLSLAPGGSTSVSESLIGVVESVAEGMLALKTPLGPLQTAVGDATAVVVLSQEQGSLDNLAVGVQVTLSVAPNDDGSIEASSVFVLPEDVDLPFGAGFAGRLGGFGGGQGAFGTEGAGQRPNAGVRVWRFEGRRGRAA